MNVIFDRRRRDIKCERDTLIRFSARDQGRYLALSRGQARKRVVISYPRLATDQREDRLILVTRAQERESQRARGEWQNVASGDPFALLQRKRPCCVAYRLHVGGRVVIGAGAQ